MFMPFGTALGVFTIIVLMRSTVKELFTPKPAAGPGRSSRSVRSVFGERPLVLDCE